MIYKNVKGILISSNEVNDFRHRLSLLTSEGELVNLFLKTESKELRYNKAILMSSNILEGVFLISDNKEVKDFSQIQICKQYKNILYDFSKNMLTQYILSLIIENIEVGEFNKSLYILIERYFEEINKAEEKDLATIKTTFEINLCYIMGYPLQINNCHYCRKELNQLMYSYKDSNFSCGCLSEKSYPISVNDFALFKVLQDGVPPNFNFSYTENATKIINHYIRSKLNVSEQVIKTLEVLF